MAISVKISQLNEGGSITSADYIPAARGIDTVKINAQQFVVNGSNIGVGPGQLFSGTSSGAGTTMQFRTLSGADGITVDTSGNTLVVSASGQNPVKTSLTGNGTTTTFAINGASSINANNYRVDIDGVLQEPLTDYTINGSNIVFNPAPPNGSKVTVVSNNLVRAYDVVPSDGSVTPQKLNLVTGNTGIGTNTPSTKLQIAGDSGNVQFRAGTLANGYFEINAFNNNPTYCVVGGTNTTAGVFGTQANIPTVLFTNNTERMRISSNGSVGIGTVAPNQTLTVNGSISATGNLSIGDATLSTPAGSAPIFACRAWVNFDATRNAAGGTDSANTARFIRASGNVTSVVKSAVGRYIITFTTAMIDANYCCNASGNAGNETFSIARQFIMIKARTNSTVEVQVLNDDANAGESADPQYVAVSVFR